MAFLRLQGAVNNDYNLQISAMLQALYFYEDKNYLISTINLLILVEILMKNRLRSNLSRQNKIYKKGFTLILKRYLFKRRLVSTLYHKRLNSHEN